jgi:pimeloyl-ACP methyl ester carboxylesterase
VLAPDFGVVTYDRRGRGDSGDAGSYAVEREIDDLAAVIAHTGGPAGVFGHSSGGILALEAVARGLDIAKIAVYEPTYVIEGTRPRPVDDLSSHLRALIDRGDRDGAVTLFQAEVVGLPAELIDGMRGAVAHVLAASIVIPILARHLGPAPRAES